MLEEKFAGNEYLAVAVDAPVGVGYKSDPSFYAPVDFKAQNGVIDGIKEGIKYIISYKC